MTTDMEAVVITPRESARLALINSRHRAKISVYQAAKRVSMDTRRIVSWEDGSYLPIKRNADSYLSALGAPREYIDEILAAWPEQRRKTPGVSSLSLGSHRELRQERYESGWSLNKAAAIIGIGRTTMLKRERGEIQLPKADYEAHLSALRRASAPPLRTAADVFGEPIVSPEPAERMTSAEPVARERPSEALIVLLRESWDLRDDISAAVQRGEAPPTTDWEHASVSALREQMDRLQEWRVRLEQHLAFLEVLSRYRATIDSIEALSPDWLLIVEPGKWPHQTDRVRPVPTPGDEAAS